MRNVVLIGTSHHYQIPGVEQYSDAVNLFRQELRELCREHQAKALAEEMHIEDVTKRAAKSVALEVADEMELKHQYSDMSHIQRCRRGFRERNVIKQEAYYSAQRGASQYEKDKLFAEAIAPFDSIRVQHWLDNLLTLDTWPLVFVCGADHCNQFSDLLRERSISVIVAFADWKPLTQ